MKRITPRIVIEPQVISKCSHCPFFEDNENGYEEHKYYCQKSTHPWGDMPGFFDPETIWENCQLAVINEE